MIGLDSNSLTYLVEALDPTYDLSIDHSPLKPERIAIVRIYFYKGVAYN